MNEVFFVCLFFSVEVITIAACDWELLKTMVVIPVNLMAVVENNSCWTHSHAVCEGESICLPIEIKNSFLLEECLPQWVLLFLVSWSKQWLARWLHSHLNVVLAHLNIKLSACQQKDIWMHVINWTGCCNKIVEMSLFISTPKNSFVPLSSTQVTGWISPNIPCKLTDHKSANLNSSKQGHNSQVTTCKLAQLMFTFK